MKKYILLMVFTCALVSGIIVYPRYISSAATTVSAVKIVSGNLKYSISCPGTVECCDNSYITYGYSMKIKSVYVRIGDTVKKGDKLFEIDKDATLQAMKLSSPENQQSDSSSSQISLTDSEKAQLNLSGFSESDILAQYSSDAGNSATGQSSSSQQSAYSDTINIPDYTAAPVSGTITAMDVLAGKFTDAVAPLIQISNLKKLQVSAQVDESMVASVHVGQTAYISGASLTHTYKGTVTQVYPSVETTADSKNVVISLISVENTWNELRPNSDVTVNIITADKQKAISVPYEAICQDDSNNEYIYIVSNGKAVRRYIKTGQETDSSVEIESGVKAGDIVIVNPPETLSSLQRVNAAPYKGDAQTASEQ